MDGLISREADDRFVVALAQCHTPIRGLDIAGVDRSLEQIGYALCAKLAAAVTWVLRVQS